MYQQFRATRLLCSFLHHLQETVDDAVIAGSFPMYCLCCLLHPTERLHWRPNDLDIFVFCPDSVDTIVNLYKKMVLSPLLLQDERQDWDASFSARLEEARSSDDGGNRVVAPAFPFRPMERPQILPRVQAWVEDYESDLKGFLARHTGNDFEADPRGVLEALRQTPARVPAVLRRQCYRVVETVKVVPQSTVLSGACSSFKLLPLNLIYIQKNDSAEAITDPAAFVCRGFDITACCVTLRLRSDFAVYVKSYGGANHAVSTKSLVFTPSSFAVEPSSVSVQMARVLKYIQRGFGW